jgi:hypothetical protein
LAKKENLLSFPKSRFDRLNPPSFLRTCSLQLSRTPAFGVGVASLATQEDLCVCFFTLFPLFPLCHFCRFLKRARSRTSRRAYTDFLDDIPQPSSAPTSLELPLSRTGSGAGQNRRCLAGVCTGLKRSSTLSSLARAIREKRTRTLLG